MRMGFWLVVAVVGAGGYLAVRRLQQMEGEIRDEIAARDQRSAAASPQPAAQPEQETEQKPQPQAQRSAETGLEEQALGVIRRRPGLLQTELYAAMADADRKQLQRLLLHLDREGRVRRTPEKSTYRLFPA